VQVQGAFLEEEHRGRGEDAADAERREVAHVGGVRAREPRHDDEEDDGDVDDGEHVVEAGGALGAGHRDDADQRDDHHRDGVEPGVVRGEGGRVDAEVVGAVVQQRREVGRPRPCHRRAADAVLQQDVARPHERHEVAQLHAKVRERTADVQGEIHKNKQVVIACDESLVRSNQSNMINVQSENKQLNIPIRFPRL
jgi:hypothetical protein